MKFKDAIGLLIDGYRFSRNQAYSVMTNIGKGVYNDGQNAALMIGLGSRDVGLDEVLGFREALLELSVSVPLDGYDTVDLCGTGGDGKNTFNISTLSSIVVAGAGYKVAKHGNYGVSSVSGSSNVLEKLGYKFSNDISKLKNELDNFNFCFLHAPLFHPALKNVSHVRKQLGIKTVFNILGPLVNPADTKKQLVGVFSLKLARLYHYLLQQEGKDYLVVHSIDGYDEISLTDKLLYFGSNGEGILTPEEMYFSGIDAATISGGNNLEDAVNIFTSVLDGRGTDEQISVVAANAAAAIKCFEKDKSFEDCKYAAEESLRSGKAKDLFYKLIEDQ